MLQLISRKVRAAAVWQGGDDYLAALRLIRSRRVGPATFYRLVEEYGSAQAALNALPEIARAAGASGYVPASEAAAEAELRAGQRLGARLIAHDSPDYPPLLREIADAPPVIWVRGNMDALRRPMIALVGSRNASALGGRMARGLAAALAEAGLTVVSGLARGIDAAAHEASLKHGTVAVMAGGVDVVYPAEHRVLAATICDRGCLVSEQPIGTEPVARHFPLRNRIISGLAHGLVVVEAATRSGSLITARLALDQGREVMAVPGHPADSRASGCNLLLRDGATLIRNAQDVLDAIGASEGCAGGAWPEAGRRRVAVGGDERVADDERPHVHAEGRPERFVACSGDERAADDEPPAPTQLDTSREESVYGAHAAGQADAAPHAAPRGPSDLTRDVPPHPDLDDLKQPQAPLACSASSTLRDTGTHPQHDAAAPKWPSGPRAAPEPRAKAPSPAPEPPPPETAKFDPIETRILALLSPSPIDENHLIRSINLPPATLAPALLSLELSGHITRLRGGQIALA